MNLKTPVMKWFLRIGSVVILVVLVVIYVASTSNNVITQPLVYNHKVHIETAGLACIDCHTSVETSSAASLPALETCSTCHSESPISQSPEELKLLEYVAGERPIPWKRVYSVPDHVFFSHRRHVAKGGLECTVCHGSVSELIEPATTQFLPITMDNCMKCHRENNVTNDCLACHR